MSPWFSDLVLRSQSDERLVSLARAGHDRAFVMIVERYRRRLMAFAMRLGVGDWAEDLVQQAFLNAFAALRDQAEVSHLSGWLHQIVRHAAISSAAATRPESELAPETARAPDVADQVESRLRAQTALTEVARLPERQRDALVLTSLQGRSRSEVALSMGMSEGAVRQLVHRARTSLRGAAAALIPYPLVAWSVRGALREGSGTPYRLAPLGAGAASAGGGLALKAGAIIATTGLVAAGLAVSHEPTAHALVSRMARAGGTAVHRAAPQNASLRSDPNHIHAAPGRVRSHSTVLSRKHTPRGAGAARGVPQGHPARPDRDSGGPSHSPPRAGAKTPPSTEDGTGSTTGQGAGNRGSSAGGDQQGSANGTQGSGDQGQSGSSGSGEGSSASGDVSAGSGDSNGGLGNGDAGAGGTTQESGNTTSSGSGDGQTSGGSSGN